MACASPSITSTSIWVSESLGRELSKGSQLRMQPAKSPLRICCWAYWAGPANSSFIGDRTDGLCCNCFIGLLSLVRLDFFDIPFPLLFEFLSRLSELFGDATLLLYPFCPNLASFLDW